MPEIIIVGGGWAGISAALTVNHLGGKATLIERTDMLLGSGLVGGIMRNNGRYTATEEGIAMGLDLFEELDRFCPHSNIDFPGHKHASLYDIGGVEPYLYRKLENSGVKIVLETRISRLEKEGGRVLAVADKQGNHFYGDSFIDATGTAGPQKYCQKFGKGCVLCVQRCPSYGPRQSLVEKAGIQEFWGLRKDGSPGSMSGSCIISKQSLAPWVISEMEKAGVAIIPLPQDLVSEEKLALKSSQQYSSKEFAENLVVLDTAYGAKLSSPFFPLKELRRVNGFENVRYLDPYDGGKGNSIRFLGVAPRENTLLVESMNNLFCAGEKSGLMVGHTEAIITGALAGYNSVQVSLGGQLLELPRTIAAGDLLAFVKEETKSEEGRKKKYTFSGAVYFEEMKRKGLYITDKEQIKEREKKAGLLNVFKPR